jgi:drug/metabolite transporter (DMT)-like permease
MTVELGILLALCCAFATNLGFFYKHRGACSVSKVDVRHPLRSGKELFTCKWFMLGMVIATGAWAFHVAAMALAPLSVVQVVLASGVVLIAVMADRIFGFEVGRRQWIGLGLTALGLIMFTVTLPATHGAHSSFSLPAMIGFEAGFFAVGIALIMGPKAGAPVEHHGVMLGAAAGILFGVSDVAIKALTGIVGHGGVLGLVSPWFLFTVAASIAAFFASARSFQDGEAIPVITVTGVAANVSAVAGGILVFGDPMPGDVVGIVVSAIGLLLVVFASALTPTPAAARGVAAAGASA